MFVSRVKAEGFQRGDQVCAATALSDQDMTVHGSDVLPIHPIQAAL